MHVAVGEVRPREVVEEEVGPRLVRLARPAEVVDLHVIETGDLAQQPQPLAWPAQVRELPLRSLEPLGRDRIEAVNLARDQPNSLTVARVLRCLPRVTNACETELDVAGGRIEQPPHRLLRGARNLEIAPHVVEEEILEDVGAVVTPARLAPLLHPLDQLCVAACPVIFRPEVLVRVHEPKRFDLLTELGPRLHRQLLLGSRPSGRLRRSPPSASCPG
ncbi:MAG TPA: hypothetical protein VJ716_01645 [Gaiellaceae bacterium]|nr:hypothetical protein [Gaiellaceae bacterium]